MLARAAQVGLKNNLRRDEEVEWALETVTTEAAKGCGFADYGLAIGARAVHVPYAIEWEHEAVPEAELPTERWWRIDSLQSLPELVSSW